MHCSTFFTLAGVALSAALGVTASQQAQETTIWVPTATVVETNTYVATVVEEIWTTVSPYEWLTSFPTTWTATQTLTEYKSIVTTVPEVERRHARDFS